MLVAFLGGLWTLFSSIGFFRNAALDRIGNVPKLRIIYIILGALYMLVAAVEALGLVAAATQRAKLVRSYVYLAALSALIIIGTGLLRIIIHFTMKNDLISTCTILAEGGTVVYFGWFGPIRHDLSRDEAQFVCQREWERDSWQEIVGFLIISLLACFFWAIARGYLRQVLDPSSPVNASRAPSHAVRHDGAPPYYQAPYNPTYHPPTLSYAPPHPDGDAFAPPKYGYGQGYSSDDKDGDAKNPFDDHHGSSSRA